MNVLDLFSGIGGFSLGLERAGMRTVAFCERDEFCRAVLRKHWPHVPCFEDVRAIDAGGLGRLGRIDVVCGGFPCQPFSVAGAQRAHADDRYLWPAMREVIALAGPAWVIGENVTGIISLALDDVLADLEGLGYATRPFVIPACAVGARHRRDRVWIVAHADGAELRDESGWRSGSSGSDSPESRDNGPSEYVADSSSGRSRRWRSGPSQELLCSGSDVAHSECIRRHAMVEPVRCGEVGEGPATTPEHTGVSGGRGWWDVEPDVGRVAHGVPARAHRLRSLGNAVVPQVVEEIGRAILRSQQ